MQAVESVEIELDRPRKMRLTLGALRAAESALNKERNPDGKRRLSIFKVINDELIGTATGQDFQLSADFLVVLLWAALKHEDDKLTFEAVEQFAANPIKVIPPLIECVNRYFSQGQEAEPAEDGEKKNPSQKMNGSSSGRSHASSLD